MIAALLTALRHGAWILGIALAHAVAEEPTIVAIAPRVPPWTPAPRAFHGALGGVQPVMEGSFVLSTTVPQVPQVLCVFLMPMGAQGRPAATAPDIVLRFGWTNQRCLTEGDAARSLATRWGFTVLTVQWPDQPGLHRDRDKGFSIYPESGSGAVWMQALAHVRTLGRLPPRKVFALGWSAGGSSAYQFADAYGDEVEAVAALGGRIYPAEPRFRGPVLLLHSDKDRVVENLALARRLTAVQVPVTHLTFPPNWLERGRRGGWAHNIDGSAWEMARTWIIALADQRAANRGRLRPVNQWPEVEGRRVPGQDCRRPLHALTDPPDAVEDARTGRVTVVVRPPAGRPPKGTVWWVDRRFIHDVDELLAPAELLAARGFTVAGMGADERVGPREVLTGLGQRLPQVDPPLTLVLVEAQAADGLMPVSMVRRPARLVLIRPHPARLPVLLLEAQRQGQRVAVLARDEAIAAIPAACRGGDWLTVRPWTETKLPGERYAQELAFLLTVCGD